MQGHGVKPIPIVLLNQGATVCLLSTFGYTHRSVPYSAIMRDVSSLLQQMVGTNTETLHQTLRREWETLKHTTLFFFNFNVLVFFFYLLYHLISHRIIVPEQSVCSLMRYRKIVDSDERGRGEGETKGKL